MIAFIAAEHSWRGRKTGSIQIVTPDKSWYIELPGAEIAADRKALLIKAGDSTFSKDGADVNVRSRDVTIIGRLTFGKLTPPHSDIMGPYRFVPFMECRHSVFSLTHPISGSLTVNGRTLDLTGGVGYIEGDRGRSFPKRYIWTQCSWEDKSRPRLEPCSLMLSVAEVKPFGAPFIGIIGFVYFQGMEHRIATYRGAKLISAENGAVSVRQGDYILTAQLLDYGASSEGEARGQENAQQTQVAHALRAPVSGEMVRLIKERLTCRARLTFTMKDTTLFDIVTDQASFEYEF
jgi:hypothetical protein